MRSDITSGTIMSESNLPEWEQLLSAAAHLQEILPGASEYRKLHPRWHDWNRVKEVCVAIAIDLFGRL
jgi:hypothetical protein